MAAFNTSHRCLASMLGFRLTASFPGTAADYTIGNRLWKNLLKLLVLRTTISRNLRGKAP